MVIVSSGGANKVTSSNTNSTAAISNTIKIVQVGNQQPRKTIAIMPNATTTLSPSSSANLVKMSSVAVTHSKDDLKRQLEELQAEVERDRLALDQKMAKIKRMKAQLSEEEEAIDNADEWSISIKSVILLTLTIK